MEIGDRKLRITTRVVSKNPRHWRIQIFENGANVGTITVNAEFGSFWATELPLLPKKLNERGQ